MNADELVRLLADHGYQIAGDCQCQTCEDLRARTAALVDPIPYFVQPKVPGEPFLQDCEKCIQGAETAPHSQKERT
jgi:hypothetical protein